MGSTFKKYLVFALLLVAINTLLDQAFKAFSVHNMLNETMDKQFDEYNEKLEYLAMGNSHNCINTHILPNSFNYGSPSENFIQSYYKLKSIIEEKGKKPETLLLQADLSSFGQKSSDRYEYNSYWIKYIDYLELSRVKNDYGILSKWHEGRFFSYVGNYKDVQLSIVYRLKMKNLEMHNGYRPHRDYRNFANEPNKRKTAWNKAQLILSGDNYFDSAAGYYFDKIFQLCQANGIQVVLIRYPLTMEFSEEESNIVPAEKIEKQIEAIATRYPVYRGTLDYHNLYFNHPEYFFDPDHLNVKGSDLLTHRITDDLQSVVTAQYVKN